MVLGGLATADADAAAFAAFANTAPPIRAGPRRLRPPAPQHSPPHTRPAHSRTPPPGFALARVSSVRRRRSTHHCRRGPGRRVREHHPPGFALARVASVRRRCSTRHPGRRRCRRVREHRPPGFALALVASVGMYCSYPSPAESLSPEPISTSPVGSRLPLRPQVYSARVAHVVFQ